MQVAIETIYVAIQTFVYCVLLFSMIGFEFKIEKFLYFYYFIFMCYTYFSMFGMMMVALTPGNQIAAIVMSFFLNFWNLFSGFLISRPVCFTFFSSIFFFIERTLLPFSLSLLISRGAEDNVLSYGSLGVQLVNQVNSRITYNIH